MSVACLRTDGSQDRAHRCALQPFHCLPHWVCLGHHVGRGGWEKRPEGNRTGAGEGSGWRGKGGWGVEGRVERVVGGGERKG